MEAPGGPILIHGVRADDAHWIDTWNFSLAGTRTSIGTANLVEGYVLPSDVDLDVLAGPPQQWPAMFLSGFLITLRMARIVGTGGHVGWGVPPYPTKWAAPETEAQILRAGERELALEKGRRQAAPTAPSRLSCIWLAENTADGRQFVQRVVGPRAFVMPVRISIDIASCRCDARWLDVIYGNPGDADSVAGYWSGIALGSDPVWETLLEGQITAADQDALERLREFIRIYGPPSDLLGPPPNPSSQS